MNTLNWLIYIKVLILFLLLKLLLFKNKTILTIMILAILRRQVLILAYLAIRQVLIVRQCLLNIVVLHLIINSELIDWTRIAIILITTLRPSSIFSNLLYLNRFTATRIPFIIFMARNSSFKLWGYKFFLRYRIKSLDCILNILLI